MKKIFAFLFVMINVALFAQNPVSVDEIGGFKNYKLGQQLRVDKSVKRTKVDGDYSIYQIVDSSILTYLGYKIFYATVECVNGKIVRLKLTFIFSDYQKLGDFSVDVIRLLGKYNSLGVHPSDNPDLTCAQWVGQRTVIEKCSEPASNYTKGSEEYIGEVRIWSKSESKNEDY